MLERPLISVLLPVHEANHYSSLAIESILMQDYPYFELIILDSTDGQEFEGWGIQDKRIRLVKVDSKNNLSMSLNIGIRSSQGEFIARMDSDDVALPMRFTKQVEHMIKDPATQVLGGGIRFIGDESHEKGLIGKDLIIENSTDNYKTYLMCKNPLFHPTVMFRKDIFSMNNIFYNEKYTRAQDIELWSRLSRNYKIFNLNFVVLEYRVHPNQSGRAQAESSKFFSTIARLKHSVWIACNEKKSRRMAIINAIRIINDLPSIYFRHLISKLS